MVVSDADIAIGQFIQVKFRPMDIHGQAIESTVQAIELMRDQASCYATNVENQVLKLGPLAELSVDGEYVMLQSESPV